jgi:serine/threonine-protein kinase
MTAAENTALAVPMSAERDPAALVGQVIADRFRIDELLGEGGMGAVYRAFHTRIKKTVALKILRPELVSNEDIVARFEREAVAAGRIEHENVAKATDFGRLPDGAFYLALEFVRGQSLAQLIAEGPVAPDRTLGIVRQIACGIDAAHQVGIVHRDLKPDNVMLVEREGAGEVAKILDFGVAKLDLGSDGGTAFTKAGTIVGTPEYMAPEQAGGANIDGRADLYALGVIAYEMLTGKPPFAAGDAVAIMTKHLTEAPPPLPDSLPAEVTSLVLELLAKAPDQRPESAARVVERIDGLATPPPSTLSGEYQAVEAQPSSAFVMPPVPPPPVSIREKGPSRVPLIAMCIGGLFLCVLLVGVVGWASTPRTKSEVMRRAAAGITLPPFETKAAAAAEPSAVPEPSVAPAVSAAEEPAEPAEAPEPTKGTAKPSAKTAAKKSTPKASKTAPKKKRKTGPGGIYIPPPSEWF